MAIFLSSVYVSNDIWLELNDITNGFESSYYLVALTPQFCKHFIKNVFCEPAIKNLGRSVNITTLIKVSYNFQPHAEMGWEFKSLFGTTEHMMGQLLFISTEGYKSDFFKFVPHLQVKSSIINNEVSIPRAPAKCTTALSTVITFLQIEINSELLVYQPSNSLITLKPRFFTCSISLFKKMVEDLFTILSV